MPDNQNSSELATLKELFRQYANNRQMTEADALAKAIAALTAPAMLNVVEAARVLADFAQTAPGRLPSRVQEAIDTIRAADNRDAAGVDSEEDAYVIERMGKLLAEIAVIVNGPEPDMTRWSYHDLPDKVRALKEAPTAAPAGEAATSPATAGRIRSDTATESDEWDAVERVIPEMVAAAKAALSPPGRAEGE